MSRFLSLSGIVVAFTLLDSCVSHDLNDFTSCNEVSYANEVKPIVTTKCALPTCHNGSNPSIPNWTIFSQFKQRAQDVKRVINDHIMPPPDSGIELSQEEIAVITCWVDQGANDN